MDASTEYTDTLKRIKEIEQEGARGLSERKKQLEEELQRLEEESAKSIAAARAESDDYVAKQVAQARDAAQREAEATLSSTAKQAHAVAQKRLDKRSLTKISEEILSEFREG